MLSQHSVREPSIPANRLSGEQLRTLTSSSRLRRHQTASTPTLTIQSMSTCRRSPRSPGVPTSRLPITVHLMQKTLSLPWGLSRRLSRKSLIILQKQRARNSGLSVSTSTGPSQQNTSSMSCRRVSGALLFLTVRRSPEPTVIRSISTSRMYSTARRISRKSSADATVSARRIPLLHR